jgi:DNA anti-recombination protein RmuC
MSDKAMEKVTKKVTKKMDKMEKKVETFGSMLDAVSGSIQDTVRFEGERGNSARQDPPQDLARVPRRFSH